MDGPTPLELAQTRLAMLALHLRAHGFDVEEDGDLIRVYNPTTALTVTITCHPRASDGGELWFWADKAAAEGADAQRPIGPAQTSTDAIVAVKGLLARPIPSEPNEGSGAAAPVIGALTRAVQAAEQVGARFDQPPGEVLRAAMAAMQPREVQELRDNAALILAVADELLAVRS